jgi:hypothetical protein
MDRPHPRDLQPFAVKNGEGIDLFDDVTHMNSRRRRSSVFHLDALRPRSSGDLGEPPAFHIGRITVEDRLAHGAGYPPSARPLSQRLPTT